MRGRHGSAQKLNLKGGIDLAGASEFKHERNRVPPL